MNGIQLQIAEVWNVEQEILDVIHQICDKHGLKYSLAYGTLLGAVRHGGFIPWDDDIDLMMPRDEYEKFVDIWERETPDGYILVNGDTNVDYNSNFLKIVKDHTTFLQHEEDRTKSFHKGIFVDIFPCDRLAPSKVGQVFQYCACAVNLLFSRGYTSGTGGVIGLIERILLCVPRKYHRKLRAWAQKCISKWNKSLNAPFISPCTIDECRKHYPHDMFNKKNTLVFNGKQYFGVSDPDAVLKISYGDYMQLPPVEERVWKHHPILIDFEQNYEELSS